MLPDLKRIGEFLSLAIAIIVSLAFSASGGWVFEQFGIPLAWMIGAMVFSTVAALAGAPIRGSNWLRAIMIPILGVMLGSMFTSETFGNAERWLPSIITMLGFVAVLIAAVTIFLHKVMGFGPVTAYFSATPGGLVTSAVIGADYGGDERRISLIHSIRIVLTVLVILFYFRTFEDYVPGGLEALGHVSELSLRDAVILLGCTAGYPVFRVFRIPSSQILGPMVLSAIVHGAGVTEAKPPVEIVNFALIVVGTSIGARFVGVSLIQLYRVMLAGAGVSIIMTGSAALTALVLEQWTGIPFTTLWLAFAPGGVAEMALISLALGLDVAFVSTHHIVRVTFMVLFAPFVFHFIRKRWDLSEDREMHKFK